MSVHSTIKRKAKKYNSYVSDSCTDVPFIAGVRCLVIRSNKKISQICVIPEENITKGRS